MYTVKHKRRYGGYSEHFATLAVIVCCFMLAMSGCGNTVNINSADSNSAKRQSSEPFRLTINSWIGFAPLYVAQEKGIFDKEGVKVELIRIEDTGARKSSMIANKVDAYGASVDGVVLDVAQGMPGKIVMAFDQSNGADGIIAKNDIKSIQDIKGKTVAVQPGLTGHFLLMYVLAKNGLDYKSVKITDMDSDKAGAAFAAGKVDVAVTWEPWLSQAQQNGGHKLITTAELPGVVVDTLCVTDKAYAEKHDQVRSVIRAWFAALDFMQSHPDEASQIMAKAYGLTEDQVKDYLSGVKFLGKGDNKNYLGSKGNPGQVFEIYRMANDIWKANGIIDSTINPEDHVDASIVQEIQ